jgi:multicomponent Na+:H+ antiporter subunit D
VAAAVAALAIALLPPFGPFLANALVVDSANAIGYTWVPPLLTIGTILSAGTILRAAGRIFLGLGDVHDPLLMHEPEAAEDEPRDSKPVRAPLMWIPTFALLVCGVGLAFVPNVAGHALADAAQLVHRGERAREVLRGVKPPARAVPTYAPSAAAYAWAAAATLGAIALAAAGLYRRRLPALVRRPLAAPARTLHALHSGVVGDYVAWLVVGLSVLGGLFALALR